jgi:hypothetical protein
LQLNIERDLNNICFIQQDFPYTKGTRHLVITPPVSYTKGTRHLVITPLIYYTKGTRHLVITTLVSYTKGTHHLVITPLVSYTKGTRHLVITPLISSNTSCSSIQLLIFDMIQMYIQYNSHFDDYEYAVY